MTTTREAAEARDVVLARIREARGDALELVTVPREYRVTAAVGTDLIERFADRVADYGAVVHRAPPRDLAARVKAALAARGVRRLVVPDTVARAWVTADHVELLGDDPPLTHGQLDAADAVLTGCAVAIAETGTIVLDAGPGQGRRALSLLPDHHVCVVWTDQIAGDVPEALARLDARRPLTWISGPSATSDIELNRIEGVHGPRHLDVVIVQPEDSVDPAPQRVGGPDLA